MQLSPDQHAALQQYNQSLSLMMKSEIKSEFRSMKKEMQDQFDGKICTQKYFKLVFYSRGVLRDNCRIQLFYNIIVIWY